MVAGKKHVFDDDPEQLSRIFHTLMPFHVREILLVSSFYDAFVIEQEGLISEVIIGQFRDLVFSAPPRLTRVNSGQAALRRLEERSYDLVITMTRNIGMSPYTFGRRVKEVRPGLSVILMGTDSSDVRLTQRNRGREGIDRAFFWAGDPALFLAIIKYVEDRTNAPEDTANADVRVILLVEDSIRHYSVFLPLFYTEIVRQTRRTISEDLNEMQRLVTLRARPKILLAETYEEGIDLFHTYHDSVLGVVTDARFPRDGAEQPNAGFQFSREIRRTQPHLPILMQSSDPSNRSEADRAGTLFLDKNSPTFFADFQHFLLDHLGFGDFVFLRPKKRRARGRKGPIPAGAIHEETVEIGRASNMKEFVQKLQEIPLESIRFHAERNHFSTWLFARREFKAALEMRPVRVTELTDLNETRRYLLEMFNQSRRNRQRAIVTDFSRQKFEFEPSFTRIGGDSLGGKGRGIAFFRALLARHDLKRKYPGIRIFVPSTVVIGTVEFDRFLEENGLLRRLEAIGPDDAAITAAFLRGRIRPDLKKKLAHVLRHFRAPLAVRSSGLLEDSHDIPIAGLYRTCMLPNNHRRKEIRLNQLCQAIKSIYASVFHREPRSFIESALTKVEEEKMAVIIQELVGRDYGERFYPVISGTVQSTNFYPVGRLKPEDGIAGLAVGLGKAVVSGEKVLRFSPRHPGILPDFASTELALANAQSRLHVLNTRRTLFSVSEGDDATLKRLDISEILGDGSLDLVVGTWDVNDGVIRDGISGAGPPVVNFSGILKYDAFPLCPILRDLLLIGKRGMGCPVEIEFAVDTLGADPPPRFALLQIRPLIPLYERKRISLKGIEGGEGVVIRSARALGNGAFDTIRDIVFVRRDRFDRAKSLAIADEVGAFNAALERSGRPYLLLGPGRWGSLDRWLGVPVRWDQISGVRILVETALDAFNVEPSQGTHFFQNMVSRGIGYLHIPADGEEGHIDWAWLEGLEPAEDLEFVRHVCLPDPLTVRVDGRVGRAVVLKPGA